MAFFKKLTRKFAVKLGVLLSSVSDAVAKETLPEFATSPKDVMIQLPREISDAHKIFMGDGVKLGAGSVLKPKLANPGSWLEHPEGKHVSQTFNPVIRIGNRVTATASLQITAFENVTIEDDVMFAANVFIADGLHAFENANVPYKYQGIFRIAPIVIKRGAWIGQNVVIMPGVTIGELAIIGANSVVTKDVPARTIAVGSPARVTREWNDETNSWQAVTAAKV